MARLDQRLPVNATGPWYVDSRCIDCGTCQEQSPDLFAEHGYQAVVARQPTGAADERRAWLAAQACPTSSIGRSPMGRRPPSLYPCQVDGPVHDLGFTSEASFGATSYLVERVDGNLMVDSPRFARPLVDRIDDLGGVAHVLLTHRDDVADADRWARRYGARTWIHQADRSAFPGASDVLHGRDPAPVVPGVLAVPVPGHTRGSVAFAVDDRWLFTGDSLAWSHGDGDLVAFRDACWFSWDEQARSLERLAATVPFSWVLPGHGARIALDPDDARQRLVALVSRMRAAT